MSVLERLNEQLGMRVQSGATLAAYTTFQIGGEAEFLFLARSRRELQDAVKAGRSVGIRCMVLGGGSNVLISDEGYAGLVIKNMAREAVFADDRCVVDSGISFGQLVVASHAHGLIGLEELAHIPGTVGGAVFGNAGSCGKQTQDVVIRVLVMKQDSPEWIENSACGFSYRSSIFKRTLNPILAVELALHPGDVLAAQARLREYLLRRTSTQPISHPCAGCIFKNPPGNFASRLIDQAGCKGLRVGGAQVSDQHANFIINVDHAMAKDVQRLIEQIRKRVKETSGVLLEAEVIPIG